MRRRVCDRSVCTVLVAAVALQAASASAQDAASEAVRLAYAAPAGCPSALEVAAAIRAHTARFHAASPGEPAREVGLTIVPSDGGFEGAVALRDAGGASSDRRLRGARCAEVAAAMVLVTAITIDPTVALGPPLPAPPPSPPRDRTPSPRPAPPPDAPPAVAVGVQVSAQTGVGPSASGVGRAFVEVLLRPGAPGALRPTIRLAGLRALAQRADTLAGTAELSLSGGRIDVCPLRLPLAGPIELRPCAALEVAAHLGAGTNTVGAASETRAWVAPGLLARLAVRVVGPLTAELEGGATFPLLRYRFYFGPDVTAHSAPPVSVQGSAGLGLAFP